MVRRTASCLLNGEGDESLSLPSFRIAPCLRIGMGDTSSSLSLLIMAPCLANDGELESCDSAVVAALVVDVDALCILRKDPRCSLVPKF